jgi:hypothetical protein
MPFNIKGHERKGILMSERFTILTNLIKHNKLRKQPSEKARKKHAERSFGSQCGGLAVVASKF